MSGYNETDTHLVTRQFNLQPPNSAIRTASKTSSHASTSNGSSNASIRARDGETPANVERKRSYARSAKSIRSRASRLIREWQIPLTNIHSAAFNPAAEHRLRGKLRWLFEHESDILRYIPIHLMHTALMKGFCEKGKLAIDNRQNDEHIDRDRNAIATKNLQENHSYYNYSDGDGDISEMGTDIELEIFELPKSPEEPSSPSIYDGPRASRAPSERFDFSGFCDNSSTEASEMENWGPEDWRFRAEVLMAECNVLRVEKDLAVRRWKQDRVEMDQAVSMAQALRAAFQSLPAGRDKTDESNDNVARMQDNVEGLQGRLEKIEVNLNCPEIAAITNNSFAHEALKRLEKLQSSTKTCDEATKCEEYSEDPTEALQERLENLVLAVHSYMSWTEHGRQESNIPAHETNDFWHKSRVYDGEVERRLDLNVSKALNSDEPVCVLGDGERKCVVEAASLRKQLDILSFELKETQDLASLIRKEYRSLLSTDAKQKPSERNAHKHSRVRQGMSEEMDCKAAIREIAAQVEAETEHWSQVQDILHDVQKEMEDLQYAREMWEKRALRAEAQLVSLQESVHECMLSAGAAEKEALALQCEVQELRTQVENAKQRHATERRRWVEAESRLKQALRTRPALCTCTRGGVDGAGAGGSASTESTIRKKIDHKARRINLWASSEFADDVLADRCYNADFKERKMNLRAKSELADAVLVDDKCYDAVLVATEERKIDLRARSELADAVARHAECYDAVLDDEERSYGDGGEGGGYCHDEENNCSLSEKAPVKQERSHASNEGKGWEGERSSAPKRDQERMSAATEMMMKKKKKNKNKVLWPSSKENKRHGAMKDSSTMARKDATIEGGGGGGGHVAEVKKMSKGMSGYKEGDEEDEHWTKHTPFHFKSSLHASSVLRLPLVELSHNNNILPFNSSLPPRSAPSTKNSLLQAHPYSSL